MELCKSKASLQSLYAIFTCFICRHIKGGADMCESSIKGGVEMYEGEA